MKIRKEAKLTMSEGGSLKREKVSHRWVLFKVLSLCPINLKLLKSLKKNYYVTNLFKDAICKYHYRNLNQNWFCSLVGPILLAAYSQLQEPLKFIIQTFPIMPLTHKIMLNMKKMKHFVNLLHFVFPSTRYNRHGNRIYRSNFLFRFLKTFYFNIKLTKFCVHSELVSSKKDYFWFKLFANVKSV